MASRWERLVNNGGHYAVADYERAAYRLVTAQVLSAGDVQTRKDYHLVAENLKEFQHALEPLGIGLHHNAQFKYLVAQPRHVLNQNRASKAVTLLVLVLADMYHRIRFNGEQGDFGEAYVDLVELQEAYQGLTGEEFPKPAEFRDLIADIERWGIARRWDKDVSDGQPFRVMIHPAIADVVTKEWLTLLDGFNTSEGEGEGEDDEITSPAEEGDDVSA